MLFFDIIMIFFNCGLENQCVLRKPAFSGFSRFLRTKKPVFQKHIDFQTPIEKYHNNIKE